MKVENIFKKNGRWMVVLRGEGEVMQMTLECFVKHFKPILENTYRERE